jgi:nitrite reductase/ring-hydroxylating ferredoxin subunit/cytochrome b subunit of formate dehydrogenase
MLDFSSTVFPGWLIWAILAPFVIFYGLHFLSSRIRKHPTDTQAAKMTTLVPVIAFDGTQRAIHWLIAAAMTLFLATGFYIYAWPNAGTNSVTLYALLTHEGIAIVAAVFLIVHVFHDAFRLRSLHHLSASLRDVRILLLRAKRLLGLRGEPPLGGKYDVFMRGYHWMLTAALVVLGITGLYFWDPYAILPSLPLSTTFLLLNVHIFSAVIVVALLIGHVYFALIRVNRPLFSAMWNGRLNATYYSKNYDPELWRPNELIVRSSLILPLTKNLSRSEFQRITGYEDREEMKSKKTLRVNFATIQTICGRYKLKDEAAWCSQKRRACAADSCPALGTYFKTKAVTIDEQIASIERRRFITKTLPKLTIIGILFVGLPGWLAEQAIISSTTTQPSQAPGPNVPIANSNTMPAKSAVNFTASDGTPAVLIRLTSGALVAYSRICTHAGCLVDYASQNNGINCPCHGAIFDPTNGGVLQGPAFIPLPKVAIRVDQTTGNVYTA